MTHRGVPRPVGRYDTTGVLLQEYASIAQASRLTGRNKKTIITSLHGGTKATRGEIFRYLDEVGSIGVPDVEPAEWRQVDGFEGKYEVNEDGVVRNKASLKLLRPCNKGGYLVVGLCTESRITSVAVHRLVASVFLPNPNGYEQVNHLDKNKANNKVSNLEWCNNQQNSIHRSSGVIQRTNQNLGVQCLDENGSIVSSFASIKAAAEWLLKSNSSSTLDTIRSSISCAVRNVYKTAFGFAWRLKEDECMEGEVWRQVVVQGNKFEEYHVSSFGRFKNKKGVVMKDYKSHHNGYVYVRVETQKHSLHRLVAEAFCQRKDETSSIVNHIDGDKRNNASCNLEWVTASENVAHAHSSGIRKVFKRKIAQYDLEGNQLNVYDKITSAASESGTHISGIKSVLYKRQKTSGGFAWEYLDE